MSVNLQAMGAEMRVRMHPTIWFAATLMMTGWFAAQPAWPHEGEDHSAPQPVASDPNLVVRSATNEDYEVVLKYRSVFGEKSTAVRVYLSDFYTNTPTERARVTLRTTTPQQLNATGTLVSPGVYSATLPYEQIGRYTLILAIDGSTTAEFAFQDLPMGEDLVTSRAGSREPSGRASWWLIGVALVALLATVALLMRRRSLRPISRATVILTVSVAAALLLARVLWAEGQDRAAQAATRVSVGDSQSRYMTKESQFLQGVRTIVARIESLRERINAVGHVVPESGALARVEAPQSGKLETVGRRLAVGDRVRQGQLIANLLVIDRLPIRAPVSGLVADVHVTGGQWVQAGEALLVILDERQVRVELPLFGENLSLALRAREATVTSSALPGLQFPARVRGLAPTAPEPTGETQSESRGSPIPPLLLTVANRGGLLRPGMLVETSLELPTSEDLIAVPESAVIRQESGSTVFVHMAPEVFEQRAVRVVGRYGNRIGLAGDIRPGDRVVVEGAQSLVSAPPVMVSASADSAHGER